MCLAPLLGAERTLHDLAVEPDRATREVEEGPRPSSLSRLQRLAGGGRDAPDLDIDLLSQHLTQLVLGERILAPKIDPVHTPAGSRRANFPPLGAPLLRPPFLGVAPLRAPRKGLTQHLHCVFAPSHV